MKENLADDLEVRPFVEDDRYAVALLMREVLMEYKLLDNVGELSADLAKIARRYAGDSACFWVLKSENEVIGTIGLRPHGEFTAEIDKLYLKKKFRKRGIGAKLLAFVEKKAFKIGYRRLFACCPRVMERGVAILERSNYRVVGSANLESVEDLYEKELF